MCEKEKFFLELIDGFEWKYDINPYPNSLFVFKDGVYLFQIYNYGTLNPKKFIVSYRLKQEINLRNIHVTMNYNAIWGVIESKFSFHNSETRTFIAGVLAKLFKISLLITNLHGNNSFDYVQNYFNNK